VEDINAENIFILIAQNDVEGLKHFLNDYSPGGQQNGTEDNKTEEADENGKYILDVTKMMDVRRFSLLTFCCYKDAAECFKVILDYAFEHIINRLDSDMERKVTLRQWVDMQTDEEFVATHFATYHGNFEIIKILVEKCGAHFRHINKYGSTVMHIAAQGD
jgi:hypothetical protein